MKITLLFLFRLFFHPNLSRHSYTAQYICVWNNYCCNSRDSSGWITTCCGLASTRTHNTATTSRSTRKWWQLCWNFSGNNSYWYCISRQYYSYHVTKEKELRSFVTRTPNLFFETDRLCPCMYGIKEKKCLGVIRGDRIPLPLRHYSTFKCKQNGQWCIRRNSSSSDEMGDTSSIPLYYSMHANIRKDGISAKPPLQSLNEKENSSLKCVSKSRCNTIRCLKSFNYKLKIIIVV